MLLPKHQVEKQLTTTSTMLVFCFRALFLSIVVKASQSPRISQRNISPKNYRISSEFDTEIHVDDSAALDKGRVSDGIGGTYTKVSSVGTKEQSLCFQQMEQNCGVDWSLSSQWKRNGVGTIRYLFVFNRKSDATAPQRWIIGSFTTRTGPEGTIIYPDIKLDTELQLHAINSAREPSPGKKVDTQQTLGNQRSLPVLDITQSGIAMDPHRVQIEQKLKESQRLVAQTQSELFQANSEIQRKEAHLTAQRKYVADIEKDRKSQIDKVKKLQNDDERLRSSLAPAQADKKVLEEQLQSQAITFNEMEKQIKQLKAEAVMEKNRKQSEQTSNDQMSRIEDLVRENKRLRMDLDAQQQSQSASAADRDALQTSLDAIRNERDRLLEARKQHHCVTMNIEEQRDAAKRELEESRTENVHLKSQLSRMPTEEAHDSDLPSTENGSHNPTSDEEGEKESKSPALWCCISAVVATLMVLLIGCIYHRHRLRKQQKEIMRLHRVISINKHNRNTDVIVDMVPNKKTMFNEGKKDQELQSPRKMDGDVTDPKCGESFNDLVQNMDEVQGVMMDDIMDQMVTEGAEESDKDQRHFDESGAGEGQVVTGAPSE